MQLKTLEIKGFKSFADKTVIHFNQNMTGVVGQNGCGKSNIVDSIRWVLGEQKSKALRLEKMDNVIFNGTKKRKPSGRAEVALTFENTKNLLPTDFSSVTISRVLYRSGDSEYRLNGVRCRLKDISNLFLDTGISSDSYAIIELKMIDEILNDKDNSRRKLFEQAAGISKYKSRKKQTLQKLKATDADLARVEDVLFEIEKNLKTLERQAKRAKRYYKIRDQYKELSIELALHHLVKYQQGFNTLRQQEEQENDRKIQIDSQIAQLEATIAQKKTSVIKWEKSLALSQKTLNEAIDGLRKKESRKNLLRQEIQFLSKQKEQLSNQIRSAEQFVVQSKEETTLLTQNREGEENVLQIIQQHLTELRTRTETVKQEHKVARQELNTLQASAKAIEKSRYGVEKKIAVQQSQQSNIQRQIQQNEANFSHRQKEVDQLNHDLEHLQADRTKVAQALTTLSTEEADLLQKINAQQQQLENNRQQLTQFNRQLDAKKNEYKLTKSLVDSLEGFPDSIKYLKKHKAWNNDAPLLLDIINCAEEYKVAIENYLKPYLNHYVVETFADAQAAIQLLNKAQKGKAGFFVLSELANTAAEQETPTSPNIIAALTIMEVANQHQALLHSLLSQVYIVDNIADLSVEQLQNGLTYLTKNGEIIRQKGAAQGGSVGAYEGKRIGKRQQLVQLERDMEALREQTQTLNNESQKQQQAIKSWQQEWRQKQQLARNQQKTLTKLEKQMYSVSARMENARHYVSDFEDKTTTLKEQVAAIQVVITQLQTQFTQLQEQEQSQQSTISTVDQRYRNIGRELNQASQQFNQQNIELHKQQNKIQSIVQQISFKHKQAKDNEEQLLKNQTSLTEASQKLNNNQDQLEFLEKELIKQYDQKKELEEEVNEIETIYYQARGSVDTVEKELRQTSKQKQQVEVLLLNIKEETNQLKMQLLSLKERLDIAFKVNIDDLLEQSPSENYTQDELKTKTEKFKKQLDKFGEINPMAVEAYDEMKERYDFIMDQRQDLIDAKQSLLETISEIETTATGQFMEAFDKVRDNFIQVFRSLFAEEDQCDLFLVDPTNPLDSAIDITAKPKGKRPQSINQLSGGEKSLTALALVFSLYLLKPAPFCILDEVDAPLDDANVSKFTNIIRQFSAQSQFILVTHNKNTMASVDVIYGVTMQEEGVSSVVPFAWREGELAAASA